MEEALALRREKKKQITPQQKENHSLVMSKLDLFIKSSTRQLSNNELWIVLNDIYDLIEYNLTFDKECFYFNEEIGIFWHLKKSYDLRVYIYVNQIMDTKGIELIKRSGNYAKY